MQDFHNRLDRLTQKFSKPHTNMLRLEAVRRFYNILEDLEEKDSSVSDYKKMLFSYLQEIECLDEKTISFSRMDKLNKEYLVPISEFLHKKYNYATVGNWLPKFSGLIIDIALLIFGLSKYYFYMPIGFFTTYIVFSIYEKQKIKKGKYMY